MFAVGQPLSETVTGGDQDDGYDPKDDELTILTHDDDQVRGKDSVRQDFTALVSLVRRLPRHRLLARRRDSRRR